MIEAVNHIGINVKDIEASMRFYREIFGFEQVGDLVDNGHLGYMKAPGGMTIEFIKCDTRTKAPYNVGEAGVYRHMAFTLRDEEDFPVYLERLRRAKEQDFPGIEYGNLEYLPYLNLDILLFRDPDGIEIELCRNRCIQEF
jgi:catechol 2,3-dioxygenase-like lactoylglutathione lyase family enzyme